MPTGLPDPVIAASPVTVADMALARRPGQTGKGMLGLYPPTLISLTMNIAGPEKRNRLITMAFDAAVRMTEDMMQAHAIPVVHREATLPVTGPEAFLCVQERPERIKRLTVGIEDRNPLGRLLDIDVLSQDATKVSREDIGEPHRRCLICGEPAAPCAASRRHPAGELFQAAMRIIMSI